MGTRGSGLTIVALASAPFAVTVFAVAMMFGGALGEERDSLDRQRDESAAPIAPEPAKAKPMREEVTYEPWELVST